MLVRRAKELPIYHPACGPGQTTLRCRQMIVVHASLRVRDDLRDEFVQFMQPYVRKTRTEPGNITFELTAHLEEPATFTMVECWRDEDAVREHFAQDYVGEFRDSREAFDLVITGTAVVGGAAKPMHDWLREVLTTHRFGP